MIHLPHGAPTASLACAPRSQPAPPPPDLASLPRPLLGFVGSLEDRIDWNLIGRVADRFREGSVILIGSEPRPGRHGPRSWYEDYSRAVARPNVHRLGWRNQAEIANYNAAFDVCLIPYQVDHPFNRASCPTKIMDYMAVSRPVVSTALPECRLYSHLFEVAETSDDFLTAIQTIVEKGSDDGRAHLRLALARECSWERTSSRLLRHIITHAFPRTVERSPAP